MRIQAALAALALFGAACGTDDELGSFRLARSLEGARRVEVVVPAELDTRRLERLAEELERRGAYAVEFERGAELDPLAARLLIADAKSSAIGALAQLHGIVFEPGSGAVWFQGRRYYGPREGLLITVEDPRRPGWPVSACIASDSAIAAELVSELQPTWKPGFRTWRNGRVEREGVWNDFGGTMPVSSGVPLERIETWPEVAVAGYDFDVLVHGTVDAAAQAAALARLKVASTFAARWIGPASERVRVHLWPDGESAALQSTSTAPVAFGPGARDLHVACLVDAPADGGARLVAAQALAKWGEPHDGWLVDALGPACLGQWMGAQRLVDWNAHLRAGGLGSGARELLERPARRTSPHVVGAQRALLVRTLVETLGVDTLEHVWREGFVAVGLSWERLESAFAEAAKPARLDAQRRERALGVAFRHGMHVVQARDFDGRGWVNLAGRGYETALEELHKRGLRALALSSVNYRFPRTTFWPMADRPQPFDGPCSEEARVAAALRARRRGFAVMLTATLYDSPTSGLASRSAALTGEGWTEFFEDYEALLVHEALTAELVDAEVLCIGAGLHEVTDSMRDDLADGWMPPDHLLRNTARFTEIVRRLRGLYDGALTYAASSLVEARQIEFWKELDFVAFELYGGLRPAGRDVSAPEEGELVPRYVGLLRELDDFARAQERPWLIAETGLPPTDRGWQEPAIALGNYDVTEQARLLKALGLALRQVARERKGLRGAYLWCWTVDPEHGNGVDRSFTLQNRAAGDELGALFVGR